MSSDLTVTVVQHASGLDPAENRAALDALVPSGSDLVVLPEAMARDFGEPGSPLGEYAESLDGPFASEVARVAQARQTTVVAGMFERSDDPQRPFNTVIARGRGRADYRKIHLYDSFGHRESDLVTPGPTDDLTAQLELEGWHLGLLTCYDLRFPELARARAVAGADVLVLPAAWVAGPRKVEHWRTLLRARAIENTTYVVAAAQPGPRYSGHSLVVAPDGEVLAEAGEGEEVLTATLERDRLEDVRRTNPSLANRRL